tara:strand:- start:305 stop:964 length:660 start_codon:yes stop_codon:yes gene_type:complete
MTSDAEGVLTALRARFAPNTVHLMGGYPRDRDGTPYMKPLFYIDRQHVIDRLDEVLTPLDWTDEYHDAGTATVCKLSIRIGDTWYSKSDSSGDTEIGGEKGAATGALKRAASKWGIGLYLYKVDNDDYLHAYHIGKNTVFTNESKEFASQLLWDDWFLGQAPEVRVLLSLCKGCTSSESMGKLLEGNAEIVKGISGNENLMSVFKRALQRYKDALKEGE